MLFRMGELTHDASAFDVPACAGAEMLGDFVRRGVAAQDAADRAAGRLTAFGSDNERLVEELRHRLGRELDEATALAQRAARTLAELMSDSVYDVDYVEGDAGRDAAHFIDAARRSLAAARKGLVEG